jgi:hypothetical protein
VFSTGLRVDEGRTPASGESASRAKKIPHGPTEWAREGKFTLLECSQDSSRALSEADSHKTVRLVIGEVGEEMEGGLKSVWETLTRTPVDLTWK